MNSSRNLLVTGGAGFIGANFVHYWRHRHAGDSITVLDALTYAGNRANLASIEGSARFRFVHGDITDRGLVGRLLAEEQIDTLVHFAAESHVDRSILGPDEFIRTNILGTHSLLEACRKAWLGAVPRADHRFHHVSTDEVYGSLEADDPAFSESKAYAPNSPYSASKAASDHLVRAYHHTYGLKVTTSNCSNNYGPMHFPEKLVPLIIVNILEGRPLPIYGDGRNIRDWLFVEDHCQGIDRVLERGRIGETYNIGGWSEVENIDLVRRLCRIADDAFNVDPSLAARFPSSPCARGLQAESLLTFVRDRPGHDRRYAIDCRKAETELGFAPSITLEEGLKRTFGWYLANEGWWRAVMDGSYCNWLSAQYAAAPSPH
ncbi:MAG: dTDP-glucose 4,6-dehydratase [Steroidobacteraceae bacterium]